MRDLCRKRLERFLLYDLMRFRVAWRVVALTVMAKSLFHNLISKRSIRFIGSGTNTGSTRALPWSYVETFQLKMLPPSAMVGQHWLLVLASACVSLRKLAFSYKSRDKQDHHAVRL